MTASSQSEESSTEPPSHQAFCQNHGRRPCPDTMYTEHVQPAKHDLHTGHEQISAWAGSVDGDDQRNKTWTHEVLNTPRQQARKVSASAVMILT
ncbi:hypothetical protein ABBQ32_14154 [Trebouxia sp. C0010 RCD-2024]